MQNTWRAEVNHVAGLTIQECSVDSKVFKTVIKIELKNLNNLRTVWSQFNCGSSKFVTKMKV